MSSRKETPAEYRARKRNQASRPKKVYNTTVGTDYKYVSSSPRPRKTNGHYFFEHVDDK